MLIIHDKALLLNFIIFSVLLGDYLLDSDNCKIPNLSPFTKEAMSVYKALPFRKCHSLMPLTSIDGDKLIVNEKHKASYLSWWQNEIKVSSYAFNR